MQATINKTENTGKNKRISPILVAKELDIIAPKEDGTRHNPSYISNILTGYRTSQALEPHIKTAIENLKKKAA